MKIRTVICDGHCMVREGLVALIQRESDLEVVAQARNGMELVRMAREFEPDVAITDLLMPMLNGIEAIHRIRRETERCKIICLSSNQQSDQVIAALDAGASGYVLKTEPFQELLRGIRKVVNNQTFLSGPLVGEVMEAYRKPTSINKSPRSVLTLREREIVQLFSEGYSTQEIAARLHLSAKTVATHREHVFRKLNIQSIAEMTRYAMREGLSPIEVPRQPLHA